ncbi:PrsW family intramembrane metalloprotease [Natrialbaceae archaeon GCM10025810]|uniref:PrsW family intramembrane metalloprotease n=1 Tax=Halovalidus salilacus TaxID=3075124 RepID=UPI00361B8754
MEPRRDPVERAADDSADLYDVSTWEPRTAVDRLSYAIHRTINYGFGAIVLGVALLITLSLLVSPAVVVLDDPVLSVFFGLSIVPAGLLAAYIWYADITTHEPLPLLVGTFLLAILFATFAAVINSIGGTVFDTATVGGSFAFFFLIVGPVEETVKLLAVRVLPYRNEAFDAVIDGAVYGAVAGLGFAAIENAIYIGRYLGEANPEAGLLLAAGEIATTRALAGPGHVIYSAIAGYYLGLAKFNRRFAGPLVVKGLLLAAIIHATYNVTVGFVPRVVADLTPLGPGAAFVGYVIAFDATAGYYLYRKIARYRRAYREIRDDDASTRAPDATEFDPPNR